MPMPVGLEPAPTTARFANQVEEWDESFGMPFARDYGDPAAEYSALRNGVVALEYSTIRKWYVEGPDAVAAVDAVFSRDVAALQYGRVAYGVVVDSDGLMIEDVTVVKFSDHQVIMLGGEMLTQEQLERAVPDGTTVTDRRPEIAVASLQGPRSRELLQRLTDADVSNEALPYYGSLTGVTAAGAPATLLRLGFTAELGYEVMVPVAYADQLWDAILAQTDLGVQMMGMTAILVARTEAGFVMNGYEYDRETLPFECTLGWTLDLDKKNFQGRDALLAKKDVAPTRLVSVVIGLPADGLDGRELLADGHVVGRITMAVDSPVLDGQTLGLARVATTHARIGTELEVINGNESAAATVRKTPVFDPERTRVRS